MNETKYFLTPNEFSVIAAGFGLSMVYGLKQLDGKISSKEICVALHNMYINNLIENDSKQFVADASLTTIMRRIKSSHFMVRIESEMDEAECTLCLYPGNPCVVVEENEANVNKVILYMDDFEQVCSMIARESIGKPMLVNEMSSLNGRIISGEKLSEQSNEEERMTIIKKQYEEIMPTEV